MVERIHPSGMAYLQENVREFVYEPGKTVEEVVAPGDEIHGFIVRLATARRDFMERTSGLEVVGKHGVGVDNIDLDAATELGVKVVNAPLANVESVAEHAVALMLALAKNLLPLDSAVKGDKFDLRNHYVCRELSGKTLGLVGIGNIGGRVARKCIAAFDMKVLAYDIYVSQERAAEMGVTLVDSLDELLTSSDFLSLHAPLTPETRGMIGSREMGMMKSTAYLVNTARGGVVDESALAEALKSGKIAGAGIDAYSQEPPDTSDPLFGLENLIATPHTGGITAESMERMALTVAEGIVSVLSGKKPQYLVNKEVWKD
jgi:D-3-phosphoglycerate dehydrogenase